MNQHSTTTDLFKIFDGILLAGTLTSIVANADTFTLMMEEILAVDCPYCGYRYAHPIVRHEIEYKGLECGWR
jgi:hypothetical protein